MENNSSITAKLEKIIHERENEMTGQDGEASLIEANDLYNRLVENGITTKRGYNLRGIEDSHLFRVKLNTQKLSFR